MFKKIIVLVTILVLTLPLLATAATSLQGVEKDLNAALSQVERSLQGSMRDLERSLTNAARQIENSMRNVSPSFYHNFSPFRNQWLNFAPLWGWRIASLWRAMVVVALGWLVFTLFPAQTDRIAVAAQGEPLKAIVYGLLGYLALVPVTIMMAITILGIPLIPVLWVGVAVARLLGQVALGLLVGRALAKSLNRDMIEAHYVILGLTVLGLSVTVPGVGGLVSLFCSMLGFGAVLWTRGGSQLAS